MKQARLRSGRGPHRRGHTAQQTFTSWENYQFTVEAPLQTSGGKAWVLASWSDGGAEKHTITTPTAPAAYTAHFNEAQCGGGVGFGGALVALFAAVGRRRARRRRHVHSPGPGACSG